MTVGEHNHGRFLLDSSPLPRAAIFAASVAEVRRGYLPGPRYAVRNSRAGANPLIGRIDDLLEVRVRHGSRRQIPCHTRDFRRNSPAGHLWMSPLSQGQLWIVCNRPPPTQAKRAGILRAACRSPRARDCLQRAVAAPNREASFAARERRLATALHSLRPRATDEKGFVSAASFLGGRWCANSWRRSHHQPHPRSAAARRRFFDAKLASRSVLPPRISSAAQQGREGPSALPHRLPDAS